MAVRNKELKVRMTVDEFVLLNEKVKKCGMSREKFIRLVLNDYQPKEVLPLDYYHLMKALNAVGNNLNQLVKLAYIQGIDEIKLYDFLSCFENVIITLENQMRGTE